MRSLFAMLLLCLSTGCSRRCYEDGYYSDLEIGIGNRNFIEVPPGFQVSPDSTAPSYFNVALRGYGLRQHGLGVQLKAFVGDQLYASSDHNGISMRCRKWNQLEVARLRLDLDPADLPPPPDQPPAPPTIFEPEPRVDTGWWVDSGVYRDDPGWKADVRIEATVIETSGRSTHAETYWFIYR